MMNVINALFVRRKSKTNPAYQYDYGQILKLNGINLPFSYEVHFSNDPHGTSVTSIGDADGVVIPDQFFLSGSDIYFWLFLHEGLDDGETEYEGVIPIVQRARPTDIEPTPVQQDVITQTIAALNEAVEAADGSANDAAESARQASVSEENAAESATSASNSANAAGASASAASASATSAENSAMSARSYANAAESSASAASASAQDAERDADRAEQAANNAGYMDMEIVDGSLIYTRTDAVDVDFDLVDGDLVMEVI